MLVTDTSWADSHPVRRALVKPFQAWRCVAWTDETLNFLVIASRHLGAGANLPDGWLLGGPEALLDAARQLEAGTFAAYVLDRAADAGAMRLCQVTGIWREREIKGDMPAFWYGTDDGEMKPCSRSRFDPENLPELVNELTLEPCAAPRPVNQ